MLSVWALLTTARTPCYSCCCCAATMCDSIHSSSHPLLLLCRDDVLDAANRLHLCDAQHAALDVILDAVRHVDGAQALQQRGNLSTLCGWHGQAARDVSAVARVVAAALKAAAVPAPQASFTWLRGTGPISCSTALMAAGVRPWAGQCHRSEEGGRGTAARRC